MTTLPRRRVGRTKLEVSTIGLGGAPMGGFRATIPDAEAHALTQEAWDLGVRYYDTSPFYGYGRSELRMGAALREKPRDEFVLSTKVGRVMHAMKPGEKKPPEFRENGLPGFAPVFDYTYDGVMRSLEHSYLRLGLSRIDIALVHDVDFWTIKDRDILNQRFKTVMDSGFRALDELRKAGIISAIGVGINESDTSLRFIQAGDFDCMLLAGRYTLLEQGALGGQSLGDRLVQRGLHAVHDLERREQAALLGRLGTGRVDGGLRGGAVGQGLRLLAAAAHRQALGQQVAHEGLALGQGVFLHGHPVDQAHAQGLLRAHMAAAEHQVQRSLCADQAGRALRATGAGQQAQLHLGQAQLGRGRGHAPVRRQRHLQAAAQGRTVDGGHHRLVAGLDAQAHLRQRGRLRRQPELADVRPGDEGLAAAMDQHRVHVRVRIGLGDGVHQATAHGGAQGIDGGVVHGHEGDVVAHAQVHTGGGSVHGSGLIRNSVGDCSRVKPF